MGAVLESYTRLPVDAEVVIVPTFHPRARAFSAGMLLRALAGFRHPRRRRAISHVHLSEGGSFVREGLVIAVARRLGSPVVVSLHGASFEPFLRRRSKLVRSVLSRADVVAALGPRGADLVRPLLPDSVRVVVLPNPAGLVGAGTSTGSQPEVALFAGEVGTRKGVDVLLDAWRSVLTRRPDARLVIAGPPGDLAPVTFPNVEWLGPVSRSEVASSLAGARLAVLPSRAEVMPMFLLEAMALGRPVVSTDVGEVAWLVGPGGRVVPPEDPRALAAALVDLLADPERAERIGQQARDRVATAFSSDVVARQLQDLYGSLRPGSAPQVTGSGPHRSHGAGMRSARGTDPEVDPCPGARAGGTLEAAERRGLHGKGWT